MLTGSSFRSWRMAATAPKWMSFHSSPLTSGMTSSLRKRGNNVALGTTVRSMGSAPGLRGRAPPARPGRHADNEVPVGNVVGNDGARAGLGAPPDLHGSHQQRIASQEGAVADLRS